MIPFQENSKTLQKAKRCWHKWNVYKEVKLVCSGFYTHKRTTKICRICGEKKVRDKLF